MTNGLWLSLSVQELYSLMFSLDWVSIKSKIMGPAHLINDYVEYGPILDEEVSRHHIFTLYKTMQVWLLPPFRYECLLWENAALDVSLSFLPLPSQ